MHNEKVALVHCPRTGGTSVQRYMLEHMDGLVVPKSLPEYAKLENTVPADIPTGHVPLRDFEAQLGRAPDSFELIIATRRDPYRVAVSQWRYWRRLWAQGNRLRRHRVAAQERRFVKWLQHPMSEFHVRYDDYGGKPARYRGDDAPGYADYGGYYPYWLQVDGEFPGNLAILDVAELDEKLPGLLAPYIDGEPGEVPHVNSTGSYDVDDYYTPEARGIVEQRFAHAFEHWYERSV